MQKYLFRNYNPLYPTFFALEKEKIASTLGSDGRIEHVGSTAIPGLGGKGVLDIVVGVEGTEFEHKKTKLIQAGYEYRAVASTPERLFFRIDYPFEQDTRRVHIHLMEYNGTDWNEMVGFRDYLLAHPLLVEEYSELKKEGVQIADGDGVLYRKHKENFIAQVLRDLP